MLRNGARCKNILHNSKNLGKHKFLTAETNFKKLLCSREKTKQKFIGKVTIFYSRTVGLKMRKGMYQILVTLNLRINYGNMSRNRDYWVSK
jgi:hypothetical protein